MQWKSDLLLKDGRDLMDNIPKLTGIIGILIIALGFTVFVLCANKLVAGCTIYVQVRYH